LLVVYFEIEEFGSQQQGMLMSRFTDHFRARRDEARSRREIERAIANASSSAMREDLLIAAQRHSLPFAR
jgi:hypothetical protein